ncbi:hypothetical protein [Phocaeicola plebeius]|uniref:hypothetical protein n=1 Tax=Phocaeicola plebeius TaxID=310297 RepID=UPI003AF055CF
MKKEGWILTISIVALCLSIFSFLIWFCEYKPVTWSLLDVCFSVISAGITVFVASQVYHSFTLVKKIDEKNAQLKNDFEQECRRQIDEFKKEFRNNMISYDNNVDAVVTQLYAISVHLAQKDYKNTLKCLMNALEKANISRTHEINGIKNPSHGIISFIQYLKKVNGKIVLNPNEVERYKMILAETKNKDAIDLIPYIQSLLA